MGDVKVCAPAGMMMSVPLLKPRAGTRGNRGDWTAIAASVSTWTRPNDLMWNDRVNDY